MVREVNQTYSSKLMRGYFPWAFQHSKQIKCLFIKKKEKKKKRDIQTKLLASTGTSFQRQESILYQKYTSKDKDLSNERFI